MRVVCTDCPAVRRSWARPTGREPELTGAPNHDGPVV